MNTMIHNNYNNTVFVTSNPQYSQLRNDTGIEVAFVGRSNVGKSTLINVLTNNKKLARTSKTPGCTRYINSFAITESKHIIDLPGYGYAKVSNKLHSNWGDEIGLYLTKRQCLYGIVLLVDARHLLRNLDLMIIDNAILYKKQLHIVLTKIDKLGTNKTNFALKQMSQYLLKYNSCTITVQKFSAYQRIGIDTLITMLDLWFLDANILS